jgi:ATP-dependent Clp protease ATP-binding subunit ClpC
MFERYTEKARRVIFFARYEAAQLGSQAIEAEHILLGLLREATPLFQKLFPEASVSMAAMRNAIESGRDSSDRISASVDLPLSQQAKQVLLGAADESQRLGHRHIGTEHLLLGLIREEQSLASQLLTRHGVTAVKVMAASSNAAASSADSLPSPAPSQALNMALIKPFRALLEVLTERGVLTAEESAAVLNWRHFYVGFYALLETLVTKGVITEEERLDILNSGH